MKEYKELLEEHQHILDEVKQLEEDLHNKPNEQPVINTTQRSEGIKTKDCSKHITELC